MKVLSEVQYKWQENTQEMSTIQKINSRVKDRTYENHI